jgi:hypothetical protein
MRNAEVAQISGDARTVVKGKVFVKLETVCRGEIGIEFAERPHSTASRARSPQRERIIRKIVPAPAGQGSAMPFIPAKAGIQWAITAP